MPLLIIRHIGDDIELRYDPKENVTDAIILGYSGYTIEKIKLAENSALIVERK